MVVATLAMGAVPFFALAATAAAVASKTAASTPLYYGGWVPYWTGTGPYPSLTVRADFRGPDIGDFVYHCHILGHEDGGMMATIRVLPAASP